MILLLVRRRNFCYKDNIKKILNKTSGEFVKE